MSDSFILRDRQWREQNERVTLSSIATFSSNSLGRETEEEPDILELLLKKTEIELFTQKRFED